MSLTSTITSKTFKANCFKLSISEDKEGKTSQVYDLKEHLISPLCLMTPMFLLIKASRGNTLKELLNYFGKLKEEYNQKQLNVLTDEVTTVFSKSLDHIQKSKCLKIFNHFIFSHNFHLFEKYCELLRKYGNIETVDFTNSDTLDYINLTASKNTNGKINNLLTSEDINSETKGVLLSCLHLKTDWLNGFDPDETKQELFTTSNGSEKIVDYMKKEEVVPYYKDVRSNIEMIKLDCTNGYSVVIIHYLDNTKPMTNDLLPSNYLNKLQNDGETISIVVPKFAMEVKTDMTNILKSNGVNLIFDKDNADLTNMYDSSQCEILSNAYVQKVIHKVTFEMDEGGIEGAAAAAVIFGNVLFSDDSYGSDPIIFKADSTFRYQVLYKNTAVVFDGIFDGEQSKKMDQATIDQKIAEIKKKDDEDFGALYSGDCDGCW